ncbi:hypothetical protein FCM35_KLT07118 [Carex littledalei]|uniref:Uncharacterized protein n=1 Tax=Carex littledalei TaxID=544730 RepID=A0A833VHU9_9POAL|nr:hypothetical protein FCM35_KLT07118 [Carex littledalei]
MAKTEKIAFILEQAIVYHPQIKSKRPDYIRRSNRRNIITPIKLFSDKISPENSATVLTVNFGEQEKDGFYDGGDGCESMLYYL